MPITRGRKAVNNDLETRNAIESYMVSIGHAW